jgi:hypothetical protein
MASVLCTAAPYTQAESHHNTSPFLVVDLFQAIIAAQFLSSIAKRR